jgi:hypothetical protein
LRKIQNRDVPAQLVGLKKTRANKIVNKFNNLNINNMEKGLNFGKAIEAAKAGKEWQEHGTDQGCSHT